MTMIIIGIKGHVYDYMAEFREKEEDIDDTIRRVFRYAEEHGIEKAKK